jgi:hypothetical protein
MATLLAGAFSTAAVNQNATINMEISNVKTTNNPVSTLPSPEYYDDSDSAFDVDIYYVGETAIEGFGDINATGTLLGHNYYEYESASTATQLVVKANVSGSFDMTVPYYDFTDPQLSEAFDTTNKTSATAFGDWSERMDFFTDADATAGVNYTLAGDNDVVMMVVLNDYINSTLTNTTTLTQVTNSSYVDNLNATDFYFHDMDGAADIIELGFTMGANDNLTVYSAPTYNVTLAYAEGLSVDAVEVFRMYNSTWNETVSLDFSYYADDNNVEFSDRLHADDTLIVYYSPDRYTSANELTDLSFDAVVAGTLFVLYNGEVFPVLNSASVGASGHLVSLQQGMNYVTVFYMATLFDGTTMTAQDTVYIQIAPDAADMIDPAVDVVTFDATTTVTDAFTAGSTYDQNGDGVSPNNAPRTFDAEFMFGSYDFTNGGPFYYHPSYFTPTEFTLDLSTDTTGSLAVIDDIVTNSTNINASNIVDFAEQTYYYDGYSYVWYNVFNGTDGVAGSSYFFDDTGLHSLADADEITMFMDGSTEFGLISFTPQGVVLGSWQTAANFAIGQDYVNNYGFAVQSAELDFETIDVAGLAANFGDDYDDAVDTVTSRFTATPYAVSAVTRTYDAETKVLTMTWAHDQIASEDFSAFEETYDAGTSFEDFLNDQGLDGYLDTAAIVEDSALTTAQKTSVTSTDIIEENIALYTATYTVKRGTTELGTGLTALTLTDDLTDVLEDGDNAFTYSIVATNSFGSTTTTFDVTVTVGSEGGFLPVDFFYPIFALFVTIPILRKLRK